MCNLIEKTKLKSVVVYKVVYKTEDGYLAFFAETPVKTGPVAFTLNTGIDYNHYNSIMLGKCSGFEEEIHAINLMNEMPVNSLGILKITLGGEIWVGDSFGISSSIPRSAVIYAGSEILKIEEVAL